MWRLLVVQKRKKGDRLVVAMVVEGLCCGYSADGFVEARGFVKGLGGRVSFLILILQTYL